MELVFLGINVLLIMAVWRLMLRRTILDHCRDRLFDLRSELRETFIHNGWDLASSDYKRLRDLVNGHLRFTEEVSILRVALVTAEIKANPELQEFLKGRLSKVFSTTVPAQQAFILSFRRRALSASLDYAVLGSGFLLMLAVLFTPFVVIHKFCAMVNRHVDFTVAMCIGKVRNAGAYASYALSTSSNFIARILVLSDYVESYSFKRGMGHDTRDMRGMAVA